MSTTAVPALDATRHDAALGSARPQASPSSDASSAFSEPEMLHSFDAVAVDDIVQRLYTLSALAPSTRPTLAFKLSGDVKGRDVTDLFDQHPARRRLRVSFDLPLLEVSMPGHPHEAAICAVREAVNDGTRAFSAGVEALVGLSPATAARVADALKIRSSSARGQSIARPRNIGRFTR